MILGHLEYFIDLSGSTSKFGMLLVNYSALYFIKCHIYPPDYQRALLAVSANAGQVSRKGESLTRLMTKTD